MGSEEQVKKAADALAAKEQWLSGKVAELSGLEKWQDPVVLTSDIVREHSSFDAVYIPIMDPQFQKRSHLRRRLLRAMLSQRKVRQKLPMAPQMPMRRTVMQQVLSQLRGIRWIWIERK